MKKTHERMREIAYGWHGGQSSPLYSFASTGKIHGPEHRHGLLREIDSSLNHPDKHTLWDAGELRELQSLRSHLAIAPDKHGAFPAREQPAIQAGRVGAWSIGGVKEGADALLNGAPVRKVVETVSFREPRRRPRQPARTVTYGDSTYKVKGKVEIPDLTKMERMDALIWLNRNTHARGYSKANPLAGIGGVISLKTR